VVCNTGSLVSAHLQAITWHNDDILFSFPMSEGAKSDEGSNDRILNAMTGNASLIHDTKTPLRYIQPPTECKLKVFTMR
jgi:hypothetical protein